jgi:hypothetical protein
MATTLTVHRLADLRPGDRILGYETVTYRTPRTVAASLAPIEPSSPVLGVRLTNPNPASSIELVLYPSQMDGLAIHIERP